MEITVVYSKKIKECYHECPYFEIDGGPGPVMICNHPEVKNNGLMIRHPECDNGFPPGCPLLKEEK